jgi:acyl-CoA reductase-like NAD-dependent aldehyde dehydrogenase
MSLPLKVKKTYKLYINGAFERSESGRSVPVPDANQQFLANVCESSRKDLRTAVQAAKNGAKAWAARSAFNRSQILYRIAEMLEHRSQELIHALTDEGCSNHEAEKQVIEAIAIWVSYAGWADKYSALFSTVNPVASAHFNFSIPEPVGTVVVDASSGNGFAVLHALLAPIICGGNTAVMLVPQKSVLANLTMAEIFHTSDVPASVINLLSFPLPDVPEHIAAHKEVPSACFLDLDPTKRKQLQTLAADNLKRIRFLDSKEVSASFSSPYEILAYQEIKTTWHPIGF